MDEQQKAYVVLYRSYSPQWGVKETWMPDGVFSTRENARRYCEGKGSERIVRRWYWPFPGDLHSERLDVVDCDGDLKTYAIYKAHVDDTHRNKYQTAELPKVRESNF